MKAELANELAKAALELDIDVSVHEEYSGRGMFGRKTTGLVVYNESDLLRCVAVVAAGIATGEVVAFSLDEFVKGLDFARDNMGRSSTIVY